MKTDNSIRITHEPDTLDLVRNAVSSGSYGSESDVVDEAVRLWAERRDEDARHLQDIASRIRRSLDDPRPSLAHAEVEAELNQFMAEQERLYPDAAL